MTTLRFISLPESIKPSHSAEFAKPVLIVAHGYCMCVFFFLDIWGPQAYCWKTLECFHLEEKKRKIIKKSLLQPEITLLVMKKPDHNSLCTTNISCSISVKVSLFFFFFSCSCTRFFFISKLELCMHMCNIRVHAHTNSCTKHTHSSIHLIS